MSIDWERDIPELAGLRVERAIVGQENGYDFLTILFNSVPHGITMKEAGQAGWCKVAIGLEKFVRVMDMEEE